MTEKKTGRRSAKDAEKTKQTILEIATEMFCEFGYERVSLRNISEKAGVSHSLIRHHFGSKEQIWHSISDQFHIFMEEYMHTIYDHIPTDLPANIKLYQFSIRLLALTLYLKQPMQLIGDAVRQEDNLIDYFIDTSGNIEQFINNLEAEYNLDFPDAPIRIKEIKWTMLMFAHGAASMSPFMYESLKEFSTDPDQQLLRHWQLFEQHLSTLLNIRLDCRLNPININELIYDSPCPCVIINENLVK